MQHPEPEWTGARDRIDAAESFGNDAPVSSKSRAPIQAIPECEAEALAYGEARPTGYQLAETRAMWWRQAALGHRLPAERGVILLDAETGITTKQTEALDVEPHSDF